METATYTTDQLQASLDRGNAQITKAAEKALLEVQSRFAALGLEKPSLFKLKEPDTRMRVHRAVTEELTLEMELHLCKESHVFEVTCKEIPKEQWGVDGHLWEMCKAGLAEELDPALAIPPEPTKKAKRKHPKVSFSDVTPALFKGKKIRRNAWHKEKWVARMTGMHLAAYNDQDEAKRVNDRTADLVGRDYPLFVLPYYAVFYGNHRWQVGWLPDAKDLEANDWQVVNE